MQINYIWQTDPVQYHDNSAKTPIIKKIDYIGNLLQAKSCWPPSIESQNVKVAQEYLMIT